MTKKPELKIGWATHEAAKFACENWHYSKSIPKSKLVRVGAWEGGVFIGVVVFGVGASANLSKSFGVETFEVCELARVALREHVAPVSRIVSIALRFLRRSNPSLKLCVSFADPLQGHYGGIYQAGNWIYTGVTASQVQVRHNGRWTHIRSVYHRIPDAQFRALAKRDVPGKYRYVIPFTEEMRLKVEANSKPYPKRAPKAEDAMRPDSIGETRRLQSDLGAPKIRKIHGRKSDFSG